MWLTLWSLIVMIFVFGIPDYFSDGVRWLLGLLGYKIEYVSDWGVHEYRYGGLCWTMCKPIHKDMGVAPPWAKRRIVKTP